MKNSLEFNVPFNEMCYLNFIHCFSSVYMFLENINSTGDIICKGDSTCGGCGGASCRKVTSINKQTPYFYLFHTMCGASSLRCRFNGEPTEMQKLIGNIETDGVSCDSDFTVDFLFGYAGYEYRKITDKTTFKDEIINSINTGKPILAKVKSGMGRFHVITGYDDDVLMCPNYYKGAWQQKPDGPPVYDEIIALYIIGNKTTPRYTLIDGLKNIQQVMENNFKEDIWNGYFIKLGGYGKFPSDDGFDKASPEERKSRALRLTETAGYMYNAWNFRRVFNDCNNEKIHSSHLYQELCNPAFSELWSKIHKPHCGKLVSVGHCMNGFYVSAQ